MRSQNYIYIVIPTLIVALMLQMWPLPKWLETLRPEWMVLVMMYWALAVPAQIGVTMAWIVGLLMDVTQGSILGQNALGLVVVIYIVNIQYQRIRVFSLVQQALVVFLLLLFKQILVLWISGIAGQAPSVSVYFLPTLVGAFIWPWLFLVLRALRRRFTVSQHFF